MKTITYLLISALAYTVLFLLRRFFSIFDMCYFKVTIFLTFKVTFKVTFYFNLKDTFLVPFTCVSL